MSEFVIFEDQENFRAKPLTEAASASLKTYKSEPLADKLTNNENAFDNQKSQKPTTANIGAFKEKNVFTIKHEANKKQTAIEEEISEDLQEESITKVEWTGIVEKASSSFSYRNVKDIQTRDESIATPMSIDKSSLDLERANKSDDRNDREFFFDVPIYQTDILNYMKQLEVQKNLRPRADYMRKQPDINDSMRSILVDWLVEVSEEYRMHSETLYLAINYVDRFLSFMSVVRAKLQLVGTASMFIASKYEEIYPPEIGEFIYITDDTYTKAQVLRMEKLLLKVLSFDLCCPSALNFINLFSRAMNIPDKVKFLAQYLCELSLLRAIPFLNYVPSQSAAAAISLAFYTIGSSIWSKKMRKTFGYDIEDLKEVIVHLNEIHHEAESLAQQAIQEKYKNSKYLQVAKLEPKKITIGELNDLISEYDDSDDLNTTAENIENVRQKTEMLFN